jgi:hypothetical protein
MHQQKKHKKKKAFSFGEVLLSAFVLAVGLTATTALIAKSLSYSYQNRDVVIASTLAQEGVELVRNVRDQNFATEKDGGDGGDGFKYFSKPDKHCHVDVDDGMSLNCSPSQGRPNTRGYYLRTPANPAGGDRFIHTTTPNRFLRYIYIDYDDSGGNMSAKVISYVVWDWDNPSNMPSSIHPSGQFTTNCTLANKCVYAEVYLTQWGIL